MKKLLLLTVLFATITGKCQITMSSSPKAFLIGEVKRGGVFVTKLEYFVSTDTNYILMFQNEEYKQVTDIKSISFKGESTLNQFYKLMTSVFLDENKKDKDYTVSFKLNETYVSVSTGRNLGVTTVRFSGDNGYMILSHKQVEKLFDKD